jgi:hypothetical protein
VDQVHVVHHKVLVEGRSQGQVAKEVGISRFTVRKYVEEAIRPGTAIASSASAIGVGRVRAGEKLFVDFSGQRPHLVDPTTGELVVVELFVGPQRSTGRHLSDFPDEERRAITAPPDARRKEIETAILLVTSLR